MDRRELLKLFSSLLLIPVSKPQRLEGEIAYIQDSMMNISREEFRQWERKIQGSMSKHSPLLEWTEKKVREQR